MVNAMLCACTKAFYNNGRMLKNLACIAERSVAGLFAVGKIQFTSTKCNALPSIPLTLLLFIKYKLPFILQTDVLRTRCT